jgi:hypothetical protein
MTWIKLKGIFLNEISQTQKEKCCMIALRCGIPPQKKIKYIEAEGRMMLTRLEVGDEMREMGRLRSRGTKLWI